MLSDYNSQRALARLGEAGGFSMSIKNFWTGTEASKTSDSGFFDLRGTLFLGTHKVMIKPAHGV